MPWGFVSDAVDAVGNIFGDTSAVDNAAASTIGSYGDVGTALGTATQDAGAGLNDLVAGGNVAAGLSGADAIAALGDTFGLGGGGGGVGALAPSSGGSILAAAGPAAATAGPAASAAGIAAPAGVDSATGLFLTDPNAASAPMPDYGEGVGPLQQQGGAGGGSGGGGGGSAGGNSIVNAFDNPSFDTVGKALSNNANWLVPAAALGGAALLGNQPAKGTNQLTSEANQLGASGQELQTYLTTGTLPPGVQASINSAAEQAKAAVRANYAKMGMSGSSAESTDLANVDNQAVTQGTQIALQLMQQGVQDTQISAQLYGELMNNAMSTDKSLVSALGALAGASARPTINVTGTS